MFHRVYDAMAKPIGKNMLDLYKGSSIVLNFLSDLEPGVATIPEDTDVSPSSFRDATASVSPTSRYKAIQVSEKLLNSASTNYAQERFEILGKNMMESIDLLAMASATQGPLVSRGAARASLDAGTAAHRLTAAAFLEATADLQNFKVPGWEDPKSGMPKWFAVMHPYAFADLRDDTDITAISQYQNASILLRYELGELGPFKLIVTPWAKTFWGGGAANGTAVETTLNGAVSALDKTVVVAADTNIAAGQKILIGTHETGNTHYPKNEQVTVLSIASTTVTIAGEGANGGLRFDHASGEAFSNDDSVGTVVFGGPESLVKVYDPAVGEYGEVVGPKKDGMLDQFVSLAWKWYGAYARPIENRIIRQEVSFSRDA
jgi:N4-gp56 family major capsid protein